MVEIAKKQEELAQNVEKAATVAKNQAVDLAKEVAENPPKKLPRFDGPKPRYTVNPAREAATLGRNKTLLPDDAAEVYRNAVPDDPVNARHWFGENADGQIYRFSNSNDRTIHFSGIDGVGDGIRNLSRYAKGCDRTPGGNWQHGKFALGTGTCEEWPHEKQCLSSQNYACAELT